MVIPLAPATLMLPLEQVAVSRGGDIVVARSATRQIASQIGFGVADQTRLATAVSELARNALQYGGGGVCEIRDESTEQELRIQVIVEDHGQGIADVELAMRDGYSSGGGLGAGLPGTKRLMDDFSIDSRPGLARISIVLIRARR